MDCTECGGERLPIAVPPDLRHQLPDDSELVTVCAHCLDLRPTENLTTELTDFATISDALPDDREVAAAMVVATALLSSLARNRQRIDALLERVEAAGVDPLLVLDRLAADPGVEPNFDIERRRRQLLQLRE